jgi:hypothetical protein
MIRKYEYILMPSNTIYTASPLLGFGFADVYIETISGKRPVFDFQSHIKEDSAALFSITAQHAHWHGPGIDLTFPGGNSQLPTPSITLKIPGFG